MWMFSKHKERNTKNYIHSSDNNWLFSVAWKNKRSSPRRCFFNLKLVAKLEAFDLVDFPKLIFELQASSLFAALKQQQSRESARESREKERPPRSRERGPSGPDSDQQDLTIEYQSNGKLSPAGHAVTSAPMTQQKQPIITQQSQQPSSGAPGPHPSPHQSPQAPQRGSPPNPSQGPPPGHY